MPTSVPNFNFFSEIWRGSQNKKWELLISPDGRNTILLYGISTVWGDQQLTLFILRTPPYLRKEVEIWSILLYAPECYY